MANSFAWWMLIKVARIGTVSTHKAGGYGGVTAFTVRLKLKLYPFLGLTSLCGESREWSELCMCVSGLDANILSQHTHSSVPVLEPATHLCPRQLPRITAQVMGSLSRMDMMIDYAQKQAMQR